MYTRYAIYFAPDTPWGDLGASWLGWDNRSSAIPETYDSVRSDWVSRPKKYGFHATIKAPFRMSDGLSEAQLMTALEELCATLSAVDLPSFSQTRLGAFYAFTAPGENAELQTLAAQVVKDLDAYRAPLTEQDIERRRASRLSPEQDALMLTWGYPHVMDQFKFHMTLTGPMGASAAIEEAVDRHFEPVAEEPSRLDSLSLMGEREDGFFETISRYSLS